MRWVLQVQLGLQGLQGLQVQAVEEELPLYGILLTGSDGDVSGRQRDDSERRKHHGAETTLQGSAHKAATTLKAEHTGEKVR